MLHPACMPMGPMGPIMGLPMGPMGPMGMRMGPMGMPMGPTGRRPSPVVQLPPRPRPAAEHARNMRLNYSMQAGGMVWLYHQTSEEAAKEIVKTQKMLRGSTGAAGGGIYFALTPQETQKKAHKRGVILACLVNLGNVALMHKHYNMRPDVDFSKLIHKGADSIRITGMPTGDEFVVYNYDQVLKIRRLR